MPKEEDATAQLMEAADRSSQAAVAATEAMKNTLLALPNMLATALAANGSSTQAAGGAAATAAATAPVTTTRDFRDRKVPDFWEHDPRAWFVILEDHFSTANPALTERQKFGLLLPLLTPAAVKKLSRFIAAPGNNVFTDIKARLLLHFERTKEEMIAELISLTSLGDRTAVDFLEHMRSLQPGEAENGLFKHIFMRSLPSHVTGIVSHHQTLDDMATAADVVLRAVPEPTTTAAQPFPVDDSHVDAIRRDQLVNGLCFVHSRWGREAYNCALPDSCRMRDSIKPRQDRSRQRGFGNRNRNVNGFPAAAARQGNGNAGRQ